MLAREIKFWGEMDEMNLGIPGGEKVVIGADFSRHVAEENRGDKEVVGMFGDLDRNAGQTLVDFAKMMDS